MVNCEQRRKYFSHKNVGDTPGNMSEWHSKWQGYFPDTEIDFKSECDNQVKSRRADILIEKDNVVNFKNKSKNGYENAFIGLAGVYDYASKAVL